MTLGQACSKGGHAVRGNWESEVLALLCGVIHNICIWVGRMLQYLHVFWGGNCDITTVCNRNLSWCLNEAGGYLCN